MLTFLAREYADDTNVVDAFIKRFKHRISKDDIDVCNKLKKLYFSVYEIVDVKEGQYSIVKDILFNTNEIKVIESAGNKAEMVGQHVLASIISDGEDFYYIGVVIHIDDEYIEVIKKIIVPEFKKSNLTFEGKNLPEIDKIKQVLYQHYPNLFYYAFKPFVIKPTVVNANNDEFGPVKCRFKINNPKVNKAKIADILDSLHNKREYNIYCEDEDAWSFHMLRKSSRKVKKADLTENDYIIYADITIEKSYLEVFILYGTAANKIIDILKKNLKDLIGMAVIEEVVPPEFDMQDDEEEEISPEIEAEVLKIFYDKHLKDTLKCKIPILNNMTPKQCLKKEPETFYRWWNLFKENIEEQTKGRYDYTWFKKELGLE